MKNMIGLGLAGLLVATAGWPARAQQAGVPPAAQGGGRQGVPGGRGQAAGTGVILGRVVDAADGAPIADAIVTLQVRGGFDASMLGQLGGRGGAANAAAEQAAQRAVTSMLGNLTGAPPNVLTDSGGHFVFRDLPKGNISFTVSANGYIDGAPGQTRPGGPARPVELDEGERTSSVVVKLWRYAVLTGRVVDDAGEPAVGANVRALRRTVSAGQVKFINTGLDTTDDRGIYRISQLVPGDYLVAIPQTPQTMPTAMMDNMLGAMASSSPLAGMMTDLMQSGPASANTAGVRVGDLLLQSSGNERQLPAPGPTPDGKLLAFQSLFYPAATSPAQASAIALKSGEERGGVDLQLRLIPTARVSGSVVGPKGGAGNASVRLVATGADVMLNDAGIDIASTTTRADGTFTFLGVPPGQYVAMVSQAARQEIPTELSSNAALGFMMAAMNSGGDQPTSAQAPVSVSGSDVSGLTLTLREGFKLSGHFEFDGQAARPAPQQLQGLNVSLTRADGSANMSMGGGRAARPDQTGNFKTQGYAAGRYVASVDGSPGAGWILKSVMVNGRDAATEAVSLDADVDNVIVTFAEAAQISGTVRTLGSGPVTANVLVFPADIKGWAAGGMQARRSRVARASKTGAYSAANMPAGEYFVIAVDDSELGDTQDPAYFETIAKVATKFTLAAGEKKPLDLQLTKVGR